MGKFNKRDGEMNSGGRNQNRTGSHKSSYGNGNDHAKTEIHRRQTQKYGGHKSGRPH